VLRRLLPVIVAALVLSSVAPADALIRPDTACRSGRVSLTFDDGPEPVTTPRLLSILARHRTQATFFVQGRNVRRHPEIVRRMVRDGHAVEDHSWDHPQLTARSDHSVRRQLRLTKREIRAAGGRSPSFYRPPYG
jgi:peptidoglycan/xylan/chitin deacetylase (PgdA/CDA1 family)